MISEHRVDSVSVEMFDLNRKTQNGRQEFSLDLIATAIFIRIEVAADGMILKQLSLRGGLRSTPPSTSTKSK